MRLRLCPLNNARGPTAELPGHIGTDFVTAGADAGSDGRVNILRITTEICLELFDGAPDNLRCGSAPSGVNGSYGMGTDIQQQEWNTIGCSDANREASFGGHESVSGFLPVAKE